MGIRESKAKLTQKLKVMPKNYSDGMSLFFGTDVSSSIPTKSYSAKMTASVADKWERNLKNAFGVNN